MKGETNEEKYSIKKSKEINIWNNANSTCGNNSDINYISNDKH